MLNDNASRIYYKASATGKLFHRDTSRVKGIMGPFRSGKTVTMVNEIYRQAKEQHPDRDGVRKSRWLVSRETSGEIATTTMDTFLDWLPPPHSQIRQTAPMKGYYKERLADGSRVELYMMFMALEDKKAAKSKLKGTDLTGAWMNEASEWDKKDVFNYINGRIGSYPAVKDNGKGNRQTSLLLDYNACPTDHWLYKLFEEERPFDHVMYQQPPALLKDPITGMFRPNPHAENIEHLDQGTMTIEPGHPLIEPGTYHKGYSYYFGQLAGADDDKVNVDVLNEYGEVHTGDKVFGNYDDRIHFSKDPIFPKSDHFLGIGQDVGFHNAGVFGQEINGTLYIFDELYEGDSSVEEFIDDYFKPHMRNTFPWATAKSYMMVVDPNAQTPEFTTRKRVSPFEQFEESGIRVEPAYTNDPRERIAAVDHYLRKMNKGQPALVIGPRCVMLRQAFRGGYKYKGSGDNRKPDKTSKYAHLMDALQYLCLYYREGVGQRRDRGDDRERRQVRRKFRYA